MQTLRPFDGFRLRGCLDYLGDPSSPRAFRKAASMAGALGAPRPEPQGEPDQDSIGPD